jgi:hypothetical protein
MFGRGLQASSSVFHISVALPQKIAVVVRKGIGAAARREIPPAWRGFSGPVWWDHAPFLACFQGPAMAGKEALYKSRRGLQPTGEVNLRRPAWPQQFRRRRLPTEPSDNQGRCWIIEQIACQIPMQHKGRPNGRPREGQGRPPSSRMAPLHYLCSGISSWGERILRSSFHCDVPQPCRKALGTAMDT